MNTTNPSITVRDDVDSFANNDVLGDLTAKQFAALEAVARLSPGYTFTVIRYTECGRKTGSSATHVMVWAAGNDRGCVGLVGRNCAQYYDANKVTAQVVKRIAHRVYRFSAWNFE